jgi:GGDEF domain-containing protein
VSAWESTTWIAVGVSALAAVLLLVVLILARRLRSPHRTLAETGDPVEDSAVANLTRALQRAREEAVRAEAENQRAREDRERARAELGWLRHLSEIGVTVDLEGTLQRGLESATRLANAAAAVILLTQRDEEPLVATFGLSPEESSRELLGMPPEGGQARAVTLTYRYTEGEEEYDEFRLRGGLAIPVSDGHGERVGTLAVFWRRVERAVTDEELVRLEALAAALTPALQNAFRFEEVRRLADLDLVTGLRNGRSLNDALGRECSRARRYERRLSLVLLRVDAPVTTALLTAAGEHLRGVARGADLVCHLEEARFAVLLPEAALADAQRAARRLQFAVGSRLSGNGRIGLPAGIVELRPEDDSMSFRKRAEEALERAEDDDLVANAAIDPRA